jgi:hypothetical protein
VYREAGALLLSCVLAGRRENGGGGICFEEMAEEEAVGEAEATRLPGCAHGFHLGCIGEWFQKASTCPMCRRDKIQFLPPEYRAARDKMRSDLEDGGTSQLPSNFGAFDLIGYSY